jgi:hypothetical protein
MALGKKNEDATTRLTPGERDAMYTKMKQAAIDKALQVKDKTFHGKRMFEKTKVLLDNWN